MWQLKSLLVFLVGEMVRILVQKVILLREENQLKVTGEKFTNNTIPISVHMQNASQF